MLSHQITRILLAWNFVQSEVPGLESLLYPQVLGMDVPGLAQAAAITDAARCRGVGVDAPLQLDSVVGSDGDNAEEGRSALDHSVELGLPTLDRAVTAWVLDHDLMQWPPSMSAPPFVDLRVRRHPAQSESTLESA